MVGKDSASCRNKGSSKNLPGFRVQPMIFVLDFNPDPALIHDRLKTEEMARLGRFERPTSGSGDQRSIQLSYRRAAGAP